MNTGRLPANTPSGGNICNKKRRVVLEKKEMAGLEERCAVLREDEPFINCPIRATIDENRKAVREVLKAIPKSLRDEPFSISSNPLGKTVIASDKTRFPMSFSDRTTLSHLLKEPSRAPWLDVPSFEQFASRMAKEDAVAFTVALERYKAVITEGLGEAEKARGIFRHLGSYRRLVATAHKVVYRQTAIGNLPPAEAKSPRAYLTLEAAASDSWVPRRAPCAVVAILPYSPWRVDWDYVQLMVE